ncbi:MAG: hypothetical protein ACYTGC_12225 [Planctomycetota bacterium]|jgi:uncharacterized membrane protein YsdA (DUF1294 family)
MSDIAQAISDLPLGSWIPIGVLLLIGGVLWAAGRHLLRVAFAAIGFLIGSLVGWLVGEAIDFAVPLWTMSLIGGLFGAVVAGLAYRAAVATGLGLVLAVAAPMAVLSSAGGVTEEQEQAADEAVAAVRDELDDWLEDMQGDDETTVQENWQEHLLQARSLAAVVKEHAAETWRQVPPEVGNRLIAGTIVGGLLGFVLGTLASTFSATMVTAFGGALAMLVGGWASASRLGFGDAGWIPTSTQAWLTVWMVLSVIGLLIQWTTRPRRADKPA